MSPNRRPNPYRHPLGRTCGDKKTILAAVVLTLVYGLPRLAFDSWKERRDGR